MVSIFDFFLVDCFDRSIQLIWLVPGMKQRMQIQGFTSYFSYNLHFLSFEFSIHIHQIGSFVSRISLAFCCVTANDCGWEGLGMVCFCWGLSGWCRGQVVCIILSQIFYCSGAVVNCPFMTDLDSCCICFIVPFLLSLSLVPLIRHC